ncbi:YceD family protein [Candidatus Magnetaquicoccus inordinatus]|uniref:YceD family protein n=1 Tax=Candidatus Magnetaquicoccus inordinatus TaxID=2496818 RepID=UPI00102CACC8|nr:DUF177 domain-containing protein [Candidatus Magnetaquicoccus inordinatus]
MGKSSPHIPFAPALSSATTEEIVPRHNLSEAGIDLEGVRRLSRRFLGFVPGDRLSELAGESEVIGAAEADLTATLAKGVLRIAGEIRCPVRLQCARCLEQFATELHAEVECAYLPGSDPAEADSQQEMVEEVTYLPDYHISIAALIEEELLLAMPMIPLCKPECAGLCPECGADRNQEDCQCRPTHRDTPFALLKNFNKV